MTTATRTAETKAADALAELLYNIGDSDNLAYWVERFENSFPSPIINAEVYDTRVRVTFENGREFHLTVTQVSA